MARAEGVDVDALVEGVCAGDAEAIADALDFVEDLRPQALDRQRDLVRRLEQAAPSAHAVIGLTGPPGAGKSSLAAALIRHWLADGNGVGMAAVDPSSRRSGGALLGDRARLRFEPGEPVFVRSMAARERLGGLAPATRAAVVVLRAAFRYVLVETVGVGQSEVDVASVADSVLLVLQPGSGDTLQFMKAGILEIPDIFVVHKWDLTELAERTRADLESILAVTPAAGDWSAPVIGASAHTSHGVAELANAVSGHSQHLRESGGLAKRRAAGRIAWALELFSDRYGSAGLERVGGREAAEAVCAETPGSALDAFAALAAQGSG